MQFWFLILLIILAVAFLGVFSRPSTIEDDNAKGRYIVYNRVFDNTCFNGRTFLTKRGAIKASRKLLRIMDFQGVNAMYGIRKVV